jgi:hypothetical protein
MNTLRDQHEELYSEEQVSLLAELVRSLGTQPLFVCDSILSFMISMGSSNIPLNPNFKVVGYPSYLGSGHSFDLAVEVTESIKILWVWSWTTTNIWPIGSIHWEFEEDRVRFKQIVIFTSEEHRQDAESVIKMLHNTFHCRTSVQWQTQAIAAMA